MLSREEAIRKHREMWNWIADRIKERKHTGLIYHLKKEYIKQHNEDVVLYNCYLCDYCIGMLKNEEWEERCKYCPLYWESGGDEDDLFQCLDDYGEKGLYRKAESAEAWEEQYNLCKKIANLKEVNRNNDKYN